MGTQQLEQESLGQRIKRLRKERGLSQIDLAQKCGVSNPWISQVEQDKVSPSPTLLHNIAKTFKVSMRELLQEDDKNMEVASRIKLVEVLLETSQLDEAESILWDLQSSKELTEAENLRVNIFLAECKLQQKKYEESLEVLTPLIATLEKENYHDAIILAWIRNLIGNNHFYQSDVSDALYHYRKAYDLIDRFSEFNSLAAKISYNVGYALIQIGRSADAIDYLERARQYFCENQDLKRYAHTLFEQGVSYKNAKDYPNALDCFEQAKAIYKTLDLKLFSAIVQHTIASEITAKHDQEKALQQLSDCLIELEKENDLGRMILIYSKMADIYMKMNRLAEADQCIKKANIIIENHNMHTGAAVGVYYRTFSNYFFYSRNLQQSMEYALKSAGIFGTIGLIRDQIESLQVAIKANEELGNLEQTVELLKESNNLWSQLHNER